VLILRDVLGFSAREAGDVLEMSPPAIDSALQRAHRTVDDKLPDRSQQVTLRDLGDERQRALVDSFVTAWERGDVDGVVALLADDVALTMPPRPIWFRGREAVAAFLRGYPLSSRIETRIVETRANGQPALAHYTRDAGRGPYVFHALDVLTLRGAEISEITAFLTTEGYERYGLPSRLA
jgi:RNA polymerase sigma-70 factor (ECF subfamily)